MANTLGSPPSQGALAMQIISESALFAQIIPIPARIEHSESKSGPDRQLRGAANTKKELPRAVCFSWA